MVFIRVEKLVDFIFPKKKCSQHSLSAFAYTFWNLILFHNSNTNAEVLYFFQKQNVFVYFKLYKYVQYNHI